MEIRKIRIAILSILVMFLAFAPLFIAPITQVSAISFHLTRHTSTYVGPASRALIAGPLRVTPSLVKPSLVKPSKSTPHQSWIPAHGLGYNARPSTTPAVLSPPTVTCAPLMAGCDAVVNNPAGATSSLSVGTVGLNGVDTGATVGVDVEPPDQGLCAGNGYVIDVLNIGELRVYNTNLTPASADITLDNLMGLTTLGWSSGGDPSCMYDYDNGGHWFFTEIVSTTTEASGGTFAGCFAGLKDACREGIAVSVTNNPTGAYNVYFVDPNSVNPTDPGAGFFLNDFAKIGNTRDAFLMFYDEFPLAGPGVFGFGQFFNGAQEFAFDKKALELGFPVFTPFNAPSPGAPNPFFNVAIENMGTDPTIQPPDDNNAGCKGSIGGTPPITGVDCWYQVIPAQSPDPTQYDNSFGGTGYMLANLDFKSFAFGITQGDNRIAEFQWTGLSNLNSFNCGSCSSIGFGGTIFTNTLSYVANQGPPWTLAPQKAGPTPLGDTVFSHNTTDNGGCAVASNPSGQCPEGEIQANGDGFTQVSYASRQIWGAVSTLITQKYLKPTGADEVHVGAAYWVVGTSSFDAGGTPTIVDQAYVTAQHEDIVFPSIAAGGSAAQDGGNGRAVIAFTLTGNGGPTHADKGGFYPSTAYGRITNTSHGLIKATINIVDLGMSPADGFTEYQNFGLTGTAFYRPRWGDYSWAIFVPNSGGKVYFASEYIQAPNCDDNTFINVDPSCGGTRDFNINWGSSLNFVTP